MSTFALKISSPEGNVFNGEIVSLSLRGTEGDLAIMAGHIPFVSSVKPCECKIELDGGKMLFGHTDGGILTVSEGKAILLSGSFRFND